MDRSGPARTDRDEAMDPDRNRVPPGPFRPPLDVTRVRIPGERADAHRPEARAQPGSWQHRRREGAASPRFPHRWGTLLSPSGLSYGQTPSDDRQVVFRPGPLCIRFIWARPDATIGGMSSGAKVVPAVRVKCTPSG